MAGGFTIKAKLTGLEDAFKVLEQLTPKLQRKVLRQALTKATKPVIKAARERVPVDTGTLKKSIGRKVETDAANGVVTVRVGPRVGYRQEVERTKNRWAPRTEYADPTRYAHLVEFGTRHSPAQSFLRTGWDASKAEAEKILRLVILEGVEKIVNESRQGGKR